MRIVITLLFLFVFEHVNALSLEGKVVDEKTHQPIASATLFLSYTKVNTTSQSNGTFQFHTFPSGRYELIVSCSGYKTRRIELISSALPAFLSISLTQLEKESLEFIDTTYEKNGWAKWGDIFLEQTVGFSPFSKQVSLNNPEQVKFIFNKVTNVLTAVADEPLIFDHDAFGYQIKFSLEKFEYQFNKGLIACKGYPLFQEMENKRPAQLRFRTINRNDAYHGSMMHFLRSLYRNELSVNGFQVRKITRVKNHERTRVIKLLNSRVKNDSNAHAKHADLFKKEFYSRDSIKYYKEILRQTDLIDSVSPEILSTDSIAYAIDSVTVAFYFPLPLEVTFSSWSRLKYPDKKMYEVLFYFPNLSYPDAKPVFDRISFFPKNKFPHRNKMITDKEIIILANGTYFESSYLTIDGYWSYWEGISMLLPISYLPKHP